MQIKSLFKAVTVLLFLLFTSITYSKNITVCSAENFYGNVAEMIGGKFVEVTSVVSNPNADPHLFCTSPNIAIEVAKAQIVIYSGADYDPWMNQMLEGQASNNKLAVIDVAELEGIKDGENPHIWYKPDTFPKLARTLAEKFSVIQPDNKAYFEKKLSSFNLQYASLLKLISTIKAKYAGTVVTATEPVFDYMASELGLDMIGTKFQWVIMNGSEPSPKMTADYISDIINKKVKVLFYNYQVTRPTTQYILKLAEQNNIPVVGISETMPENKNVIEWLLSELEATKKALDAK